MPPSVSRCAYQLHVQLQGTTPAVWRRLVVAERTSLAQLHRIVQTVLGWHQPQPYCFEIAGQRYGQPNPDDPNDPTMDARRYTLGQLQQHGPVPMAHSVGGGGGEGAALLRIRVEAVQPLTALAAIPDCLDGRHQPDGSAFDIAAARLRVQALQTQPQKAGECLI